MDKCFNSIVAKPILLFPPPTLANSRLFWSIPLPHSIKQMSSFQSGLLLQLHFEHVLYIFDFQGFFSICPSSNDIYIEWTERNQETGLFHPGRGRLLFNTGSSLALGEKKLTIFYLLHRGKHIASFTSRLTSESRCRPTTPHHSVTRERICHSLHCKPYNVNYSPHLGLIPEQWSQKDDPGVLFICYKIILIYQVSLSFPRGQWV